MIACVPLLSPLPSPASLAVQSRRAVAAYPELAAVIAAAILGLTLQPPLAWLAAHHGIDVLLALLVFATALTIDPAAPRRVASAWRPVALAIALGVTVLPALSWAVSWLAPAGPLRDGVLVTGLAPCEIASVATTAMAAGEAAVAAGLLIGSTLATVLLAAPLLTLFAASTSFSPSGVIANLALVVALPLAAGLALRAWASATPAATHGSAPPAGPGPAPGSAPPAGLGSGSPAGPGSAPSAGPGAAPGAAPPHGRGSAPPAEPGVVAFLATERAERVATRLALGAVAALVALVASEVRFSAGYAAVAGALLLFIAASALLGRLLAARSPRPVASALLLTTSMRDFAIAAAIATAAFGPRAAAPLGLYGVAVLIWGTACAGHLRHMAQRKIV